MGIVALPPQIKLVCDSCGQDAIHDDGGSYAVWDATEEDRALDEACFYRQSDGSIICDDCAADANYFEAQERS
jgi:hypothetical protein